MIYYGQIRKTLNFLDSQYNISSSSAVQVRPMMFSKLAVIEYCGWLEETFDEIARNGARGKLKTKPCRQGFEKQITATVGFVYQKSGRRLICSAIGIAKLLEVEKEMKKNGDLERLQSYLGQMNGYRKRAAHTSTRGVTAQYLAPSAVIENFNQTKPILLKMWSLVGAC